MTEIDNYKVVPLRLTPDAQHCHSIYMREHFIRLMDPNKPRGRTLFLLNIPPYVTEDSLRIFFKKIGAVISVCFAEKPGRDETQKWKQNCDEFSTTEPPFKFKVAYVVFQKSNSVEKALKVTSLDLFNPDSSESYIESGVQLWFTQYEQRILNEDVTQELIDKFMANYDEREKAELEAAKTGEADANGWVTVGKQGRNAGFEQKESTLNRLEDKLNPGKKKKELENFYTFQIRESKMKNIIDLRRKFEEDKKKIEILKKTRRFRPF